MLGKLLRHEWKATWKLPFLLCLFILLSTAIGCLSFYIAGKNNNSLVSDSMLFIYTMVAVLILNMLVLFAGSISVMIYFPYRFYKSLFSDEGYLTNTLPVTADQLIFGKLICASFWMLIITLLSAGGSFILTFSLIKNAYLFTGSGDLATFREALNPFISEILSGFENFMGISIPGFLTLVIITIVLSCISCILIPYLCLALGQLFRKHRVACAVGFYFAIFFTVQIVTGLISMPIIMGNIFKQISSTKDPTGLMGSIYLPSLIIAITLSVILSLVSFLVTRYILRKKLNLE